MKRIALVSCVGKKLGRRAKARDLYQSPWFLKARAFAERTADEWYILSALRGLVFPWQELAPYEMNMGSMTAQERRVWASQVLLRLANELPVSAEVVILAGVQYREHLIPELLRWEVSVSVPMEGLGIGKQMQWLDRRELLARPGEVNA